MGQLIIAHTSFHVITPPLAVAIFLGLAVYVITCHPRRSMSWVFGLLCLIVGSIYVNDILITSTEVHFPLYHFLTRWGWVALILSALLYLHLVFFYFSSTWQQRCFQLLPAAYLFSLGLALVGLFSDLLVDGHLYHSIPHLIAPKPGLSFFAFHAGFLTLAVLAGTTGLFISYRSTHSPTLRQQIVYLLVTTVFGLIGGIIHWVTIFTETTRHTHHLLPDTLFILAGVLYARAIVSYGSFAGCPLARRNLFYSTLATVAGLTGLYLTVALDQWLIRHIPLPYYFITGLCVVIVATSFPTVSQWITARLDQYFFQTEQQQQKSAQLLAETLADTPAVTDLPVELLDTLRVVLDVESGYVALTGATPSGQLMVQAAWGNLSLQPGDIICQPPLSGPEPQFAATLPPQFQAHNIALFCPLHLAEGLSGILALGEKRNKRPFTASELLFCAELLRQLETIGRMVHLRAQHQQYHEAAQLQRHALRQLSQEIISFSPAVMQPEAETSVTSLEIRILGPLQVSSYGQIVSEAAWGSEKAKGMLAYLLWKSPAGVTREELSEVLWPDRSPDDTANVFHVTLHRLRRVLQIKTGQDKEVSYIQHDRGYYRFNLEAPHWIDAVEFQNLIGSNEPMMWQAAISLYRGAYLEDMAWVLPVEVEAKRRRLEQLYTDGLRRLAAQTPEREALFYLEQLLAIEPADETVQRALTLGYLARGRGDLARRQVERWQQALREFDLEASADTRLLWEFIQAKNTPSSP